MSSMRTIPQYFSKGCKNRKSFTKSVKKELDKVTNSVKKETNTVKVEAWGKACPDLLYSTKICEQCELGDRNDEIILCDVCDDGYHMGCLDPILESVPDYLWICPACCHDKFDVDTEEAPSTKRRKVENDNLGNGVYCERCTKGHDAERMLLCDGCDRGFYMYCLTPIIVTVPAGDWSCPSCKKADKLEEEDSEASNRRPAVGDWQQTKAEAINYSEGQ